MNRENVGIAALLVLGAASVASGAGVSACGGKGSTPPQAPTTTTTGTGTTTTSGGASATADGDYRASNPVPDAEVTVSKMRPAWRACYEEGQKSDPSMEGALSVEIRIDGDGNVLSATPTTRQGNLSQAVVDCVVARARAAKFSGPGGSGSTLDVPLTFRAGAKGPGGREGAKP